MHLQYFPQDKIIIDNVSLEFGQERIIVREKISSIYREDNQIISVSNSADDDIHQRRDIYKNINSSNNFFFLNYDINDCLSEVEVHYCNGIQVFDAFLSFEDDIESVLLKLNVYSQSVIKSEGEFFFKELHIVVMTATAMGGEGNNMSYFYCAKDVTHLE